MRSRSPFPLSGEPAKRSVPRDAVRDSLSVPLLCANVCVCVFLALLVEEAAWASRVPGLSESSGRAEDFGGHSEGRDIDEVTGPQGEETAVEEARQVGGPGGVAPRTFGEGFGHGKPGSDRSRIAHWRRGAGAGAQGKGERQPSS